jgi:GNAT superfamily N-acetyltransferase
VVEESMRGTGVGRAIVDEAERWARERDCHRIVVTTALRRADAHAFYERIGYTHTGRRYAKDFD